MCVTRQLAHPPRVLTQFLEVCQLDAQIDYPHDKHDSPPKDRQGRQQVEPPEGVPLAGCGTGAKGWGRARPRTWSRGLHAGAHRSRALQPDVPHTCPALHARHRRAHTTHVHVHQLQPHAGQHKQEGRNAQGTVDEHASPTPPRHVRAIGARGRCAGRVRVIVLPLGLALRVQGGWCCACTGTAAMCTRVHTKHTHTPSHPSPLEVGTGPASPLRPGRQTAPPRAAAQRRGLTRCCALQRPPLRLRATRRP